MKKPFLGDGKVVTGANVLCVIRVVLAVVTAWLILDHQAVAAFWCAFAGILTDLLDGFVAKRGWLGGKSNLGKIIDPIADKAMILVPAGAILYMLYRDGYESSFTFWFLLGALTLIAAREIMVLLLKRSMAKMHGIESAIESARASMALQSGGFLLLVLTASTVEPAAAGAIGIMVSASLVAGWDYLATWRRYRREAMQAA